MADKKISALTAASTPLAGTEVLPIVQSGATVKVAVSDLTAGRAVSASTLTASSLTSGRVPYAGTAGLLQDSANLKFDGNNLGVKATISGWSGANAIQINAGAIYNSGDDMNMASNAYYDGTNWRYIDAYAFPNQYAQYNGVHTWSVSSSTQGAGNIITWTTAATLDRSSNYSVYGNVKANNGGGTSYLIRATGSATELSTFGLIVQKYDNNTTASNYFVRFDINAGSAYSGAIAANGAGAAAFISYSDKRLKENIQDLEPQLDKILALRPVTFDYKSGGSNTGFIAQDVQSVYPDAVGEDENGYLTLGGFSKTDARLIKAIQELKADLDATKAELAALKG